MGQCQAITERRGVFEKRRKFALAARPVTKIKLGPNRPTNVKAMHPMGVEPYPETERKEFRFLCGACGTKLKAPESITGKRVECPNCGNAISVPTPPAEPQTGKQQTRWINYAKQRTIKFFCVRCGQRMEADRLMAETRFACPRCQNAMIVPLPVDE